MRKNIAIVLGGLLLILIVSFGVLLSSINLILEEFKPQIISRISNTLGQPVLLEDIRAQFLPSFAVELKGIALESDAQTSVGRVLMDSNLSTLFDGTLAVENFIIEDVSAAFRKSKEGVLYLGSIALGQKQPPQSAPKKPTPSPDTPVTEKDSAPVDSSHDISFQLKNAEFRNISVTFLDESRKVPKQTSVNGLNAKLRMNAASGSYQVLVDVDANQTEIAVGDKFKKPKGELLNLSAEVLGTVFGNIEAKNIVLQFGTGKVEASGTMTNTGEQPVKMSLQASNIELGRFMPTGQGSEKIQIRGLLSNLNAETSLLLKNAKPSVASDIKLSVLNGEVIGLNFLRASLEKSTGIPGISEALLNYVPEKYHALMNSNSTGFDSLVLETQIKNQSVQIRSLQLQHPQFHIEGKGNVNFEGRGKIDSELRISSDLSMSMVERQPKLKLLLDENNNLVFPVEVLLRKEKVHVRPNMTDLAKRAFGSAAKEAVEKQIDKIAPKIGDEAAGILKKLF